MSRPSLMVISSKGRMQMEVTSPFPILPILPENNLDIYKRKRVDHFPSPIMNHKKSRMDIHGDDPCHERSSLILVNQNHHSNIKTEVMDDESENPGTQSLIKMEAYPENPTLVEFGSVHYSTKREPHTETGLPLKDYQNHNQIISLSPRMSGSVSSSSGPSLECIVCGAHSESSDLIVHQIKVHPDQFFPIHRDKALAVGWNIVQFQHLLMDKLFPSFVEDNGDDKYGKCTLCFLDFDHSQFNGDYRTEMHLIQNHKRELKKKLTTLLRKGPLSVNTQVAVSTFRCDYCYKNIRENGNGLKLHLVRFHPEHYFSTENDNALASGISLEQFQEIIQKVLFAQFQSTAGGIMTCLACSKEYNRATNPTYIFLHLVSNHLSEMKKRLDVILMEDPLQLEKLVASAKRDSTKPRKDSARARAKARRRISTQVKSVSSEALYGPHPNCPYCHIPFTGQNICGVLEMHIVRSHPEHYFPEEMRGSPGLNLEQFQNILKDSLFPQFYSNSGGITSCVSCKLKYNGQNADGNRIAMHKHLIDNHDKELKEKLKIILQSPNTGETQSIIMMEAYPETPFLKEFEIGQGTKQELFSDNNEMSVESQAEISAQISDLDSYFQPEEFPDNSTQSIPNVSTGYQNLEIVTEVASQGSFSGLKAIPAFPAEECEYCGPLSEGSDLMIHLVEFHPEKYFPDESAIASLSGWKPEQFQQILKIVLFPHFTKNFGHEFPSCTLCSLEFGDLPFNKGCVMERHLIYIHKPELHKKLKSLLKSGPLPEPEDMSGATQVAVGSFSCNYCGKSSSSVSRLHLVQFHPEHYFPEEGDKAAGSGFTMEQFQKVLNEIIFVKFTSKVGRNISCTLCKVEFTASGCMSMKLAHRLHLIQSHKPELVSKLNKVLRKTPLKLEKLFSKAERDLMKAKRDSKRRISYLAKRASSEIYYGPHPKCPYCHIQFSGKDMCEVIEIHIVRSHPEHYFPQEMKETSAMNLEQFQQILKGSLFPQFILKTGGNTSCLLCNVQFNGNNTDGNRIAIQKHLIDHHSTELKDRLKSILQLPITGQPIITLD